MFLVKYKVVIYFVLNVYTPNTASINRFLAFVKGFEELEVSYRIVVISPNQSFDRLNNIYDSRTTYLWMYRRSSLRWINKIQYYVWSRFLSSLFFKRFVHKLKKNDIVVLFSGMQYLHLLLKKISDCKIYHERTEHPDVYNIFHSERKKQQYLDDCKRLNGLFVISSSLKKTFIELGVDSSRIHIINMVVDSSRFENLQKSQITEKYIAYCGTVSNEKDGVDDLIRSFAVVARKNKYIKLYVIGPTPSSKESTYNLELIRTLDLTDKIVITGRIPSQQMPLILKNAQVLVLARPNSLQAQNGFPTKLGEYLLTENPVVITRTGDIPLFLKNGVSALLAEPGNIMDIANKICWALEHPQEAAQIGWNGSQVARRYFNYKIESKKLYSIIMN